MLRINRSSCRKLSSLIPVLFAAQASWCQTATPPSFTAAGIVNAASYATGTVAPGEIVSIFGDGLGPATAAGLQLTPSGLVSNTLGGTQVLFDNIPAPLIFVQQKQISAIVPYGVAGKTSTQIKVTTAAGASVPVILTVANTVPGLFTADSSGKGAAAALNQDGITANSPEHPAPAGSIVVLFGTGEGPTIAKGIDGKIATAGSLPTPAFPMTVTIGGIPAEVAYAGAAPTLVAGIFQLDVQVPLGVTPGPAVPVVVTAGPVSSPGGPTIAVSEPNTATLALPTIKFHSNLSDSLVLQASDSLGNTMSFFGDRDAHGAPLNLTSLLVKNHLNQTSLIQFDQQGRPVVVQGGDGTAFNIDWLSTPTAQFTATSPAGTLSINSTLPSPAASSVSTSANVSKKAKPSDTVPTNVSGSVVTVNRCGVPTAQAAVSMQITPISANVIGDSFPAYGERVLPALNQYYIPIPTLQPPDPQAGAKAIQSCETLMSDLNPSQGTLGNPVVAALCDKSKTIKDAADMCNYVVTPALGSPYTGEAEAVIEACDGMATGVVGSCILLKNLNSTLPGESIPLGQSLCNEVGNLVDTVNQAQSLVIVAKAVYNDHVATLPPTSVSAFGPFPDFTIDINDACIESIEIGGGPVSVGKTAQLTALAHDQLGNTPKIPFNFVWNSLDQDIATVDQNTGVVTGVEAGTARISVTETNSNVPGNGNLTVNADLTTYSPIVDAWNYPVTETGSGGTTTSTSNGVTPGRNFYYVSGKDLSQYTQLMHDSETCSDCDDPEKIKWSFEGTLQLSYPVDNGTGSGTETYTIDAHGGLITESDVIEETLKPPAPGTLMVTLTSVYQIQTGVQTLTFNSAESGTQPDGDPFSYTTTGSGTHTYVLQITHDSK